MCVCVSECVCACNVNIFLLLAVDCELSDWLPWEECSVQCGRGVTTRRRKVVVNARNGGRVCDVTSERRLCWGTSCKVTRALNGVEELKGMYDVYGMYGICMWQILLFSIKVSMWQT